MLAEKETARINKDEELRVAREDKEQKEADAFKKKVNDANDGKEEELKRIEDEKNSKLNTAFQT